MKGFREGLTEQERAQVIELAPSLPAFPEFAAPLQREQEAALLLDHVVGGALRVGGGADLEALVVHPVQREVKVRTWTHFAAKVEVMSHPALGEILAAVHQVITAVDGPEIAAPYHVAAPGAVPDVGRQEPALARRALQGLVDHRHVEHRDPAEPEDGAIGHRPVPRDNVEFRAGELPPRSGHLAVRYDA